MSSDRKKAAHKEHFCVFCKEKVTRINQHFIRKHKNEDKVQDAVQTKDKIEKFWKWKKLRQEGDFEFNLKNDERAESRIVVKTAQGCNKARRYFDCPICHARIRTTSRCAHRKICKKVLQDIPESTEDRKPDMYMGVPEAIINQIRGSLYLSKFLEHLFEEKKNKQFIRTAITDLTAVHECLEQKTGQKKQLVMYFVNGHVDNIINSIMTICKEEKIQGQTVIRHPFTAQRICRLILSLGKFLILYYSKRNLDCDVIETTKFLNIFEAESQKLIKKQCYHSIRLKRFKKHQELPKTSDINKLIQRLREETPSLIKTLEKKKDPASWRSLAENILLRLTIFNRRRGGAVEKMTVKDYESTESTVRTTTEESLYNLTEEEKEFLGDIKIVEIMHKCNNVIQIYITKEMQDAMNLLKLHREFANVNSENEYFFAVTKNSVKPISCVKVMAKYRELFPKKMHHLFTATNLRKHGATVAQILKLTTQDKEEWASHMGHSVDVHNRYYRKPEEVNAVLKTARILQAMDKGILKFYKGKKISEIPLRQGESTLNSNKVASSSRADLEEEPINLQPEPQQLTPKTSERKKKRLGLQSTPAHEGIKRRKHLEVQSTSSKKPNKTRMSATGFYSVPEYKELLGRKFFERREKLSTPRSHNKRLSWIKQTSKFRESDDEESEEDVHFPVRRALFLPATESDEEIDRKEFKLLSRKHRMYKELSRAYKKRRYYFFDSDEYSTDSYE